MIRKTGVLLATLFIIMGCARVQVVAPKEPIKVDIAMRLDVYQHVEKEIDEIEDMVTGNKAVGEQTSMLDRFTGIAYAEEELHGVIKSAIMRRKARYDELSSAQSSGRIGENKSGLVELRGAGDASLNEIISAENSDRMIIYRRISEKNGAALGEVQKLYARKRQSKAPSGTPVESPSGEWTTK